MCALITFPSDALEMLIINVAQVHGRVMLDPEIFEKLSPESEKICVPYVEALNNYKLSDEQIMTVSPLLFGFSLGDKIWGK